ncbi:MAG: maleylpyruvate isomerase N-terminal domain-containing protein [Dermatophilaceae bacterium]
MPRPDPSLVDQFLGAGQCLVDLGARVPADAWDRPALGSWDVRALLGHAGRGLWTLLDYLSTPTDQAPAIHSAADYFAAAAALAADPGFNETIRRRGVDAGAALGADPVATLGVTLARARTALAGLDHDPVIPTALGPMHVTAYLPTRVVELTVHSQDLAAALGLDAGLPDDAVRTAMRICVDVAILTGRATLLLGALTGRHALPAGFSTVP